MLKNLKKKFIIKKLNLEAKRLMIKFRATSNILKPNKTKS